MRATSGSLRQSVCNTDMTSSDWEVTSDELWIGELVTRHWLLVTQNWRLLYRIAAADFADDLENLRDIERLGKHGCCAKRLVLAFFELAPAGDDHSGDLRIER